MCLKWMTFCASHRLPTTTNRSVSHHNLLWCETSGGIYSPSPEVSANPRRSPSPLLPFLRRQESHSRDSENFPRSGTLQLSPVGECGFAAEIPAYAGMEEGGRNGKRAGMKRGREWKSEAGMRDIADCLTLRRLRGGVKIRASEFLGGGGMPTIIVISPPPATASRSHPPPQAAEGKNSFFVKKRISILAPSSIPAKAGISAATAAFADRRH